MIAEPVQNCLNAFEGQRTCSNSGSRLHGAAQETRRPGCNVLRLLILRLHVLRVNRLIGRLCRRRVWIAMTEQGAKKACGVRWLPCLLRLLLKLGHLRLGLFEGDVLNEDGLREDVKRIRVRPKRAIQQRLGVGVFFLQLCLVHPLNERVKELLFLGSQCNNLRRPAISEAHAASQNETRSCRQSCVAEVTVR
jgi:hypothetical protein